MIDSIKNKNKKTIAELKKKRKKKKALHSTQAKDSALFSTQSTSEQSAAVSYYSTVFIYFKNVTHVVYSEMSYQVT